MSSSESLSVTVRLLPTHSCDVCSPDAGQFRRQRSIELSFARGDREVDLVPPVLSQGGRWRSASADQRLCEVVECASVVVGDVAQEQAPLHGDGKNVCRIKAEPVTLRVVIRPYADEWISFAVDDRGSVNVQLQGARVMHRLPPLQPSAFK